MLYGILAAVIILLIIKIAVMRKSIAQMTESIKECLEDDVNGSVRVSSYDRYIRLQASEINRQLKKLRRQRHKYLRGDEELKTAVTNISHDLRTPLTAICGYLDLLEREDKSPEVERYLSIISERVEAMKLLTEELFRYSTIMGVDSPDYNEDVVINEVLEDSIAGLYGALKSRGIEPVIEICEERVTRKGSRAALSRVFSNILNNAVKYSEGDLYVRLTADGDMLFENTAYGLDPLQAERLFDRFYTVEAARNSTGLGLSIAKTFVEQMGGSITSYYAKNRLSIEIKM
ncbi:MAG: HAMP domain-containing histidine kinase [Ruminococcus sp.]|nr:HAMP domain-containing histidine kinase [Ruminococcus sp.]